MWQPNAKVYINGYEFGSTSLSDGLILEGINITHGRSSTDEQPRPGICSLAFVVDSDTYHSGFPRVTSPIRVTAEQTDATEITLFTGVITEISIQIDGVHYSPGKPVTVWNITAASVMSELARQSISGTAFALEFEGERIASVLNASGYPASLTWAELSGSWAAQVGTWLEFATPYTTDTGLFEVVPIAATETANSLSLCTAAANSALGIFYETTGGKFIYQDANHRRAQVTAGIEKTYDLLKARQNFGYTSRAWDFINSATVTDYYGGASTYDDTISIAARGKVAKTLSTNLYSDGPAQIAEALVLAGTEAPSYDSLEFVLNGLTDAEIDDLISTQFGDYILIENVPSILIPDQPTPIPGSGGYFTQRGFVEGWRLTIRKHVATITLNWSPEVKTDYYLTPATP